MAEINGVYYDYKLVDTTIATVAENDINGLISWFTNKTPILNDQISFSSNTRFYIRPNDYIGFYSNDGVTPTLTVKKCLRIKIKYQDQDNETFEFYDTEDWVNSTSGQPEDLTITLPQLVFEINICLPYNYAYIDKEVNFAHKLFTPSEDINNENESTNNQVTIDSTASLEYQSKTGWKVYSVPKYNIGDKHIKGLGYNLGIIDEYPENQKEGFWFQEPITYSNDNQVTSTKAVYYNFIPQLELIYTNDVINAEGVSINPTITWKPNEHRLQLQWSNHTEIYENVKNVKIFKRHPLDNVNIKPPEISWKNPNGFGYIHDDSLPGSNINSSTGEYIGIAYLTGQLSSTCEVSWEMKAYSLNAVENWSINFNNISITPQLNMSPYNAFFNFQDLGQTTEINSNGEWGFNNSYWSKIYDSNLPNYVYQQKNTFCLTGEPETSPLYTWGIIKHFTPNTLDNNLQNAQSDFAPFLEPIAKQKDIVTKLDPWQGKQKLIIQGRLPIWHTNEHSMPDNSEIQTSTYTCDLFYSSKTNNVAMGKHVYLGLHSFWKPVRPGLLPNILYPLKKDSLYILKNSDTHKWYYNNNDNNTIPQPIPTNTWYYEQNINVDRTTSDLLKTKATSYLYYHWDVQIENNQDAIWIAVEPYKGDKVNRIQ